MRLYSEAGTVKSALWDCT